MDEQQLPIEDLINVVLSKLEGLKYSFTVLREYRRCYAKLLRFAKSYGYLHYSEDLGREFLLKTYCLCRRIFSANSRLRMSFSCQ